MHYTHSTSSHTCVTTCFKKKLAKPTNNEDSSLFQRHRVPISKRELSHMRHYLLARARPCQDWHECHTVRINLSKQTNTSVTTCWLPSQAKTDQAGFPTSSTCRLTLVSRLVGRKFGDAGKSILDVSKNPCNNQVVKFSLLAL